MSMYKPLILATAMATLAACATVPQPLQGTYTDITSVAAQQGGGGAVQVRWGGQIIETKPGPQETCFYVLQRPLDDEARPKSSTYSEVQTQGRFVACRAGFYDPEVFTTGRDITVTGVLQGSQPEKVGEYTYPYPRVEASVVYLWPERVVNPYPGWYDPWWGPYWGPYWGPWGWGGYGYYGYYGGYYRTRVIVTPHGGGHSH